MVVETPPKYGERDVTSLVWFGLLVEEKSLFLCCSKVVLRVLALLRNLHVDKTKNYKTKFYLAISFVSEHLFFHVALMKRKFYLELQVNQTKNYQKKFYLAHLLVFRTFIVLPSTSQDKVLPRTSSHEKEKKLKTKFYLALSFVSEHLFFYVELTKTKFYLEL